MVEELPNGVPASDVRPAHLGRDHRRSARALHQRIVDRLFRRLGECFRIETDEVEVARAVSDSLFRRGGDLRLEFSELLKKHVGAEDEVAAIPEVILLEIARGLIGIGLFDEGFDGKRSAAIELTSGPNVAVVGCRVRRADAKGDDAPVRGGYGGMLAGLMKSL